MGSEAGADRARRPPDARAPPGMSAAGAPRQAPRATAPQPARRTLLTLVKSYNDGFIDAISNFAHGALEPLTGHKNGVRTHPVGSTAGGAGRGAAERPVRPHACSGRWSGGAARGSLRLAPGALRLQPQRPAETAGRLRRRGGARAGACEPRLVRVADLAEACALGGGEGEQRAPVGVKLPERLRVLLRPKRRGGGASGVTTVARRGRRHRCVPSGGVATPR